MAPFRRLMEWIGAVPPDEEEEATVTGLEPRPEPSSPRVDPVAPRVHVVGTSAQADEERQQANERRAVVRPFNPQPERPKIHLVLPTKYGDVQEIGDRMKQDQAVIVNLEGVEQGLRRRIIDFSSGLTYALGGRVKEVGTNVYLLCPPGVEVADEEMFRMRQRSVAARGAAANGG